MGHFQPFTILAVQRLLSATSSHSTVYHLAFPPDAISVSGGCFGYFDRHHINYVVLCARGESVSVENGDQHDRADALCLDDEVYVYSRTGIDDKISMVCLSVLFKQNEKVHLVGFALVGNGEREQTEPKYQDSDEFILHCALQI